MTFKTLVDQIVTLVDTAVIPLLYALAFLFFLWGAVRFFFIEGEEGREKGKQSMFWGLIGLAVIFGIWGIVHLFLTVLPGYGA